MRRGQYKQLDEGSSDLGGGSGGTNEVDFQHELQKQFLGPRRAGQGTKLAINTEQTKHRLTEVRSIYLDHNSETKNIPSIRKKNSKEEKINAEELIKVLQNGKQRRNQRHNPNNQKQAVESPYTSKNFKKNLSNIDNSSTQGIVVNPFLIQSDEKIQMPIRGYETIGNRQKYTQRKVIKEVKEQAKQSSRKKNERQWKQIESLLYSKKGQYESPYKKNKRSEELQAAKQMLSGKVSIIWIFIIKKQISDEDRNRILKMYSELSDSKYVAPLIRDAQQLPPFLQIPNSLFKIVTDVDNATETLRWKINKKVVEFYIFNDLGQKGIARALSYKSLTRKVKGIYNQLERIIDRAEEEIENQIMLFYTKNGISQRKQNKKFPSFLKLSGEDKSYATLYRANLYGAKNLPKDQLSLRLNQFMNLVEERYGNVQKEKTNIIKYKLLNHLKDKIQEKQARQIIRFYVKQSFYYQILNSMLRTMKTTEEFKPCIFPFYENYQAIKLFYKKDLEDWGRKIPAQTLYRGAKLRKRDFMVLQTGVFIEMFGFMSTSKNKERAVQFTDRDGYIFVIHVPEMTIPKKFDKYDHGFVDINKHKLADPEFEIEEQVLFNSLNIYKVLKVENDGEYNFIHIQYGPIFQLLNKYKKDLTSDERDVLLNYQHCVHMLEGIQDQGDVHLLANQFEQSKQYYAQKLKENSKDGKYLYKLANVQQQCGELEEADKNVKASLELQVREINLNDRQKCLKVFSIHTKNAQISFEKEDFVAADQALKDAIELLTDDDEFEKGKKLRERGQIKFKKGQIREAEKLFFESEKIFKNITKKAQEKRSSVNRGYFFSFFALLCSSTTQQQLQEQKQKKLQQIDQLEQRIDDLKQQIEDELIKVNNSMKEAAMYAEDKEKYEEYVKKAKAYLIEIQARESNDPREKARLKAMEATIKDHLQLVQTEKLLQQAIALVESNEPFDPTVGKYSEVLASLQKKQLEKYSNPKAMATMKLDPEKQKLVYNETEHKEVYNKCKKNYEKALNILLYNSKTQASPEVMSIKNQLGELDFNQSNFAQSQRIIREVKEQMKETDHSQISKSCLLLSKISYARGQIKDSFENVEEALRTLRSVLMKKKDEQYEKIFQGHSITLEIKTHRLRIYMKQMKHDLCLKDIQNIREIVKKKSDYSQSHSLLADLMQLEGQNLIVWKNGGEFDDFFLDAIQLREKQLGKYNLSNAVTYANYAKHLILAGAFEDAAKMLNQCTQIFGCFSDDHPVTWLLLYCTGLFNERKNNVQQSIDYLTKCLKMAGKKFDKSHITINKIRLQFGKMLHNAKKFEEAIRQLEALQNDLDEELLASSSRNLIESEKDDEKITVKKFLYNSLKESYTEVEKSKSSKVKSSKIGLIRITQKMEDLRRTYKISEIGNKIDEKKSE